MRSAAAHLSPLHCPACGGEVAEHQARCPHCQFTGQDSIEAFGDQFPEWQRLPHPDGWLSDQELRAIDKTKRSLRSRFPQVRFCIEGVALPAGASLPVYGFWRLNTAPLATRESARHRLWSVLLVIEPLTGRAAVACGYRIGHLVRDDAWQLALQTMCKPWRKGHRKAAICSFLKEAGKQIDLVWTDAVMRPD